MEAHLSMECRLQVGTGDPTQSKSAQAQSTRARACLYRHARLICQADLSTRMLCQSFNIPRLQFAF